MRLSTHPTGENQPPQLKSSQEHIAVLVSTILQQTNPVHKTHIVSSTQHACLEDFLQGIQKQAYTKNRLLANHTRTDIGAWVSMYHLPVHSSLIDILQATRKQLPELLSSKERETIGHLFFLHTYIRTHNQTRYLNYIATLPPEEQSYMIQLYKQMIIGWMSHANGSSIYFPHLPTGRSSTPATPRGEDEDLLEEQFSGYKETKKRLDNSPDHVQPPRSSLQDVFHDILLISTLAQQLPAPELLDTYIQQRSNSGSGYIASHAYTSKMFFPEEKSYTEQSNEAKTTEDHYLTQSYNTLTHMRSLVGELLEDWSVVNSQIYSEEIFNCIRGKLELLTKLNKRIDLHHFVRHLPSESDKENEFSTPEENIQYTSIQNIRTIPLILEKDSILCSSEWKYASISATLLSSHIKNKKDIILKAFLFSGINNYDKHILMPISISVPISGLLNLLLDYLTFLPTSSVHVTHSRILKWIQNTYATEGNRVSLENGTVVVLTVYGGRYQSNDMCSSPDLRKKTLEEGRVFLHTHAIHCGTPLTKYTTSFTAPSIQQVSCSDFCYWMIDYLRVQTKKDAEIGNQLYNKLMEIFTPLHTVRSFLADHYETIIGKSIDAHTGEDGVF